MLDTIKGRFSVRKYADKPVSDEDLNAVLEGAQFAQSARNSQDWRFVIVRKKETRDSLVTACCNQLFVANAPVVIVCCGINTDYVMTCGQHSYPIDVSIAMENMALVAHDRGLGTCWLGSFYENEVKSELGIPKDGVRIVGILTLGYPALHAPAKNREPCEAIVRFEKWKFPPISNSMFFNRLKRLIRRKLHAIFK
ncbi:nitroreductase family protein [Candidatus Latescibacterota bacterium]